MSFIKMQSVTAFESFATAVAEQAFITTAEVSSVKKFAAVHCQLCLVTETGQVAGAVAVAEATVAEYNASRLS